MKSVLALAVLALIATITDSSVVDRSDNLGEIGPNDKNLFGSDVSYSSVIYSSDDLNDGSIGPDDGHLLNSDLPSQPGLAGTDDISRSNSLNVGFIGPNDRNVLRVNVNRSSGGSNQIQIEDVTFRHTGRISFVQAVPNGPSNSASPRIISGGVGQRTVTVRFTSQVGKGFRYILSIWGA